MVGNQNLVRVAVVHKPHEAIPLQGTWIGTASDHLAMKVAVKVTMAADARAGRCPTSSGLRLGNGQRNIPELKVLLEKILPRCNFDLTTEAPAILRARASLMPTRVGGRARDIDCELDMKLRETRQRQ